MKIKKVILFLVLYTGIIGCGCLNGGTEWNIEDFSVRVIDKNANPPLNGIIEGDSLTLLIQFEAEFVESNSNPLNGLMSSALATTCEEPGDDGLNDKIKNFFLTSTAKFNEIPIGESLTALVSVNGESITEWISDSDFWMYNYDSNSGLTFLEKPEASSKHIFTLRFVMESGRTIERSTSEIQWN